MNGIKLRAWDKWGNGFVYATLAYTAAILRLEYQGKPPQLRGDLDLQGWQKLTGMKDKNGKEIYEGDILSWWGGRIVGEVKIVSKETPQVMQYVIHCPPDRYYPDGYDVYNLWSEESVEVVGNIYQDAHLLEVKK